MGTFSCNIKETIKFVYKYICLKVNLADSQHFVRNVFNGIRGRPGFSFFLMIDRYRKVAADHCVGGVENSDKYRPITSTCPVQAPSGLRLSVAKSAFSTGERVLFILSQAQVKSQPHPTK